MSERVTRTVLSKPLSGVPFGRQLLLLLLILAPIAALIAWRIPVSYPEGDFVLNVLDVAKTGHVSSTFTPDTYPYLAGIAYKAAGVHGFLFEQVTIYLLVAVSVLWLVRLLTTGTRAVVLSAVLTCSHPDLLTSIPRVWDTELTCLLLLAFTGLCVAALSRTSPAILLAIATFWGAGLSVRPNFAILILPVLYVLWVNRARFWIFKAAGVLAWGAIVFLLLNRLAHGSFYLAQNGPYNFFAGANDHTQAALLRLYNAESSVPLALAALGVHSTYDYDLALRPTYMHQALLFIRSHPLQWLWLAVIKLITLLRANTKSHAAFTPGWLIQVVTTICVPLWLATLAAVRKLTPADKLILLIVATYVLPFLLTNADPRFRPPLDLLVLAHAASLLVRRQASHIDQSATALEGTKSPQTIAAA